MRTFKSVLLLLVAALIVTACGNAGSGSGSSSGSGSGTGGNSGSSSEPVTLKLWTFHAGHANYYLQMADRFNQKYPDTPIKLEAETYPYEEMHSKALISLQSGVGAPDFIDVEVSQYSNFMKGQVQLEDLTSLVAPVRDKYVEARLQIYSKDGKVYGLPTHVGATVAFYNREIMEKAGVNIDDIVTWDDYVEAGKKVVANAGVPMTTVETTDQWSFWPLISQRGSDYFDKDGNISLDNEINIETLQFLADMVHKHKIAIPTPGGLQHSETFYGFMNSGGVASTVMPMWFAARIMENMPDLKGKLEIRPMPVWEEGGNRSAGMGGTATVLTNQSKHKELAKKFLEFAKVSEEGNIAIWTIIGGYDPPRWDVYDTEEIRADSPFTEFYGHGVFDMLLDIRDEIIPINMTEGVPEASNIVKRNILFKVVEEKADPAEVLRQAVAELKQ